MRKKALAKLVSRQSPAPKQLPRVNPPLRTKSFRVYCAQKNPQDPHTGSSLVYLKLRSPCPRRGTFDERFYGRHRSFGRGLCAAFFFALHAQAQQVCVSPPSGLFSWWDGDAVSGTTVSDTQGSNNGLLTSGTTTAVGKVGRAFSFDGIDDEVTIADHASLNPQSFTIDAWVFPTALDGQFDIVVNKEVGTGIGQLQYEIGIRGAQAAGAPVIPTGNLAFFVGTPTRGCGEQSGWCDGQAAVPLNTWTHVALKYDGTSGTATAYVNGQVTRTVGGFSGAVPTTAGPLRIGNRSPLPPLFANEKFNGLIDEVEFFDRALSTVEIQSIFTAGGAGKCKTKSVFVPIVLSSAGLSGSFYTSEVAVTNRSSTDATLSLQYSAAFGGGSGTGSQSLPAGRQRIITDGIEGLRAFGVPIPDSGNRGGTLIVGFSGVASASEAAVIIRTTSAVSNGRAGLAYLGIAVPRALTATSYLCGLRQNTTDRSNVAVQNVGTTGDLVLRVTVFSGDAALPGSQVLPDVTLTPGGFFQFSEILKLAGFTNGYARVERISGTAPYYAYGVINDQANSDGSFLFPVLENSLTGKTGQTLPVIVETGTFNSELTVTNFSTLSKKLDFEFIADAVLTANNTAAFSLTIQPGEQRIIPNIVGALRQQAVAGIGPAGPTFAGALFARVASGDMGGIVVGARTGSRGGGGQYGLFYNAVPFGSASTSSAWIYGLQQNAENRSNLALVNTGEVDTGDNGFSIDIYDGTTGVKVNTVVVTVGAKRWQQINGILANAPGTTQGYVQVRKTSGNNPFIAYSVVNDGGAPSERSDDGAFVPAQ